MAGAGMEHLGPKGHLRRLEWVIRREMDGYKENTSSIRTL
jgi:hypothetical protein